jgi:hypothetical protein
MIEKYDNEHDDLKGKKNDEKEMKYQIKYKTEICPVFISDIVVSSDHNFTILEIETSY